jgi:hypothetical protein
MSTFRILSNAGRATVHSIVNDEGAGVIIAGSLGPSVTLGALQNNSERGVGYVATLDANLVPTGGQLIADAANETVVTQLAPGFTEGVPKLFAVATVGAAPAAAARIFVGDEALGARLVDLGIDFGAGARARAVGTIDVAGDRELVLALNTPNGPRLTRVSSTGRVGWTRSLSPGAALLEGLQVEGDRITAVATCTSASRLDGAVAPTLVAGAAGGQTDVCVLDIGP